MNSPVPLSGNTVETYSAELDPGLDRVRDSGHAEVPPTVFSRKSRRKSGRRLFLFGMIVASWLILLGIGYVGYLHTAAPLKQQVLAQEVRSLELALDSVIRERCLVVDAIAGNLEMETFLRQGAMPNLVKRIKSMFPDFVSVQILDQQGTIVAMAGDVAFADGGLPSTVKIDWPPDAAGLPAGWRFSDDPSENRWHLACKHSGSRFGVWFVRATFSREPLQGAAQRAGLEEVRPFALTRFAAGNHPSDYFVEARTGGSPVWFSEWRWMAAVRAETLLRSGGWLVTLDDAPTIVSLYLYPAAAAGVLFVCMLGSLAVLGRTAPSNDGGKPGESSSEPPSAAGYAAVVAEMDAAASVGPETPDGEDAETVSLPTSSETVVVASGELSEAFPEIPEFLEVTWDEGGDPVEEKSPSDFRGRGGFSTTPFTAAGA